MLRCASVILSHALVAHKSSPSQRGHQRLPLSCYVAQALFLSHALVAHKSSPSQRGHQCLPLSCYVVFEPCAGRSQELALTERAPAFTPVAMHWSLTRARPHREGTSVAPSLIRKPVAWGAHQSSFRGASWGACVSCIWPSRLRSGQPMLSLCCRIHGKRHLFSCASHLALCQPMSGVTFPIARPSAVRRSRFQGCPHAVGRS